LTKTTRNYDVDEAQTQFSRLLDLVLQGEKLVGVRRFLTVRRRNSESLNPP
jgi:hypothetical protein